VDIGLIVEVADSSLDQDQRQKSRIYARAGIRAYWIVNLVTRQIEVFADPQGTDETATYVDQRTFRGADVIHWQIDKQTAVEVRAADLLPE
jgi:Uma2 family endonuclease